MRLYDIMQQFSNTDKDDTNRNSKTQDYIKLSKGKLNGSDMTVSEYVNYIYKETVVNSIKDCKSLSSLYNKIKDMDSKDDINKEVRNMESYIPKLKLTETKELYDNGEILISNIAASTLNRLFKAEEDILNKQIKDLEKCKKEIKRWAAGGADVEAEIGVDRVNHFKNKEKTITNSLNALSGCVTNILTYLSTLNSSIQKLYGKRKAQSEMIYSLLKKNSRKI